MASLTYLLCSLLSILINLDSCYVEHHKPPQEKERKALFVLGDSLFDPGNNVYVNTSGKLPSVYWPYGETFFKHATGRFTDGRIVPDFIATFAGLPFLPPYLKPIPHVFTDGASFASGGACVLPGSSDYIDFPIQVKYFKHVAELLKEDIGEAQAKRVLTNAVYLITIGGNDYERFYNEYPNANEASKRAFVKLVIGNLYKMLREITSVGAKKFAFENVGPLGCMPSSRLSDGRCNEIVNAMAIEHNKALAQVMKKLEREVPGFRYSMLDYYTAIEQRVFNPRKFGFKEGEVACCGDGPFRGGGMCGGYGVLPFELCSDPFEYVWFDGGHPSEGANIQLSKLMWEGGPLNLTGPYTIKQLFQI